MSDPPTILHFDGEPIVVKKGPISDGDRERIEQAVGAAVPEGKRFVALAILDVHGRELEAGIGAAWKSKDDRWKLFGEVTAQWDGDVAGRIGVVYSR